MLTFRERLSLAWRVLTRSQSGLVEYAEREFRIANRLHNEDAHRAAQGGPDLPQLRFFFDDYQTSLRETIFVFSFYGHSGGSAPFGISCLNRLLRLKPLSPLTGAPDEWMDCSPYGSPGLWQNRRASTIFKREGLELVDKRLQAQGVKGGPFEECWDGDGILFRGPDGMIFARPGQSDLPIIFPYEVPDEPLIVDVDESGARIEEPPSVRLEPDVVAAIEDVLAGSASETSHNIVRAFVGMARSER